ncbi:MAG: hypothetical protein KKE50_01075 [Nanoarchaeota archaeon]|nr:hypothetical protein [Nanoarchaeota archaeon]
MAQNIRKLGLAGKVLVSALALFSVRCDTFSWKYNQGRLTPGRAFSLLPKANGSTTFPTLIRPCQKKCHEEIDWTISILDYESKFGKYSATPDNLSFISGNLSVPSKVCMIEGDCDKPSITTPGMQIREKYRMQRLLGLDKMPDYSDPNNNLLK